MSKLLPPHKPPGYRPTRVGQKFGELSIIGDGERSGWYLAKCGLCGREESVSEKRLAEDATACLACTARSRMETKV
jgi:hypothetical protein